MGEQNLELAFIADHLTTAKLHTELELNDRLDCIIDRALTAWPAVPCWRPSFSWTKCS
jgi:hypothetical protein